MAGGDDPIRSCTKWETMPTPGDINISAAFNVGDLTPYIEGKDENIGDLMANPLQGGEFDAEQSMKPNLLININAWVQLGPLLTYEGGTQVFGYPKSLSIWEP